jgi:hypothetical protein
VADDPLGADRGTSSHKRVNDGGAALRA